MLQINMMYLCRVKGYKNAKYFSPASKSLSLGEKQLAQGFQIFTLQKFL